MDQLLTFAVQAAFFVLFALALVRYLRDRTPLNREVLVVFASIAGLFATQLMTLVWPGRPQIVASAASVLLIAEPLLVLRLIRHFQPVDRRLEVVVLGAFVLSAIGLLTGLSAANRPILLAIVGYFVITSLIDSVFLFRAARQRIGASRNRLQLAALASGLLGIAILVAASGSGTTANPVITTVSRLLALIAALAFLAAFAPPPFVRRFQQRAVAFDVARGLVTAPTGTPGDVSWHRLADATRQITGASAVAIAIGRPRSVVRVAEGAWKEPPEPGTALPTPDLDAAVARIVDPATLGLQDLARDAGATRVLEVPIGPDREPIGRLLAFLAGSPLFVEDDLALLTLLAALTARAIEREEAVAERTTLVDELRRTNDELAQASAAKSDFLAAMSHELRTPLNSIIGFSELMLAPVNRAAGLRPLDVADWATHIHGAGLQLLDLINEVLDLAKIEAGRLELRHERFDVPSLLGRTVDAMRPLADRRQIAIAIAPADPITIEADPARVRQIVYNLLSNAIKFSPDDGQIDVTTTRVGDEVRIAVEDRGPGIAREDQRRLFEAFQQTASGRAQAEGTGLGLALARQLAERHGGRIELVSELGAGSLFTLVLPVERPPALAAQQPAESKGPLVLVIEDDASSAELLRAYLEPDGYRVTVASTGEQGIDQMRHLQPAAVILDILLPGIDGWEVMQRARAEPATRDIPILVVSLIDDAELGLALGAVDFFTKPVDRSVLLLRLRRLLDTEAGPQGRPTILAIDDEPIVVEMYRAMLEPNGFDVVVATSGKTGVAAAKRLRPDAVVLDLTMPDMDGFEVAAALHADPATEQLPILVATSRDLTDADKARLNGHVAGILRKGDDAIDGLRRWLRSHVAEPPAPVDGASGAPETNGRVAREPQPRSDIDRHGTPSPPGMEAALPASRSQAGR